MDAPRLVASLARPDGNMTGLAGSSHDTSPKQLGLLAAVVPNVSGSLRRCPTITMPKGDLMRCSKRGRYSITSSARASSVGGSPSVSTQASINAWASSARCSAPRRPELLAPARLFELRDPAKPHGRCCRARSPRLRDLLWAFNPRREVVSSRMAGASAQEKIDKPTGKFLRPRSDIAPLELLA
jgi:hypothetical protein